MASVDLNWESTEIALTNNKLYIFTDGLLESRPQGIKIEELGLEGVKNLVKYVANLSPAESVSKLMSLFKNNALTTNDDATLLVIGL
jgi:serine phosphatase RsbU (regulator of sigma subunit)